MGMVAGADSLPVTCLGVYSQLVIPAAAEGGTPERTTIT